MTPKKNAVLLISALFLTAALAEARPGMGGGGGRGGGRPGGGYPGGGRPGGGYQPPRPAPPRPMPPRPIPPVYPQPPQYPYPPQFPQPGAEIVIPANVFQRVAGNGVMFDAGRYFNLSGYYNYRIVSMEIQAQAAFNNSLVDVVVNNQPAGSMVFDGYRSVNMVYPNNARIGVSVTNLLLFVRGDLNIQSVTLRLSAY